MARYSSKGVPTTKMEPSWPQENRQDRVNSCKAFLFFAGFITKQEMKEIEKRVKKWVETDSPKFYKHNPARKKRMDAIDRALARIRKKKARVIKHKPSTAKLQKR